MANYTVTLTDTQVSALGSQTPQSLVDRALVAQARNAVFQKVQAALRSVDAGVVAAIAAVVKAVDAEVAAKAATK